MKILISNQFGSVSISDIDNFENHNQITLPEDYRRFLLEHNGGVPEPNIITVDSFKAEVHVFFGMHDGPSYASLWHSIDVYQERIPSWYVPIARDSGGNLFIMSLWEENKGTIAFWDHEKEAPEGQADQYFDNLIKVADSFSELINNLTYL